MIDWERVAKENGMTRKEFEKEILSVAAVLGVMRLDNGEAGDCDTLKFTCHDSVGKIGLYVRRLTD